LWASATSPESGQLTHVGKYQGEVVASNILGEAARRTTTPYPGRLHRSAGGRRGRDRRPLQRTARLSELPKTETYTRAYAESKGFLTLLADGERLTGAYALGPEAGEWLQQATLAIRARVPIEVLRDTIQPFPTFSEIYVEALKALRAQIAPAAAVEMGAR
jgi:dihydrolipoamide dehydrogenase